MEILMKRYGLASVFISRHTHLMKSVKKPAAQVDARHLVT